MNFFRIFYVLTLTFSLSYAQTGTGCNDYEVEIDTNSCDLGSCGTYLWSYNHYSNEFDGQEWYYPSQITECSSTAATVGASGGGTYDFGDYQEIWFYIGSGVNTYNITALNATDIHIERGSGSGNNVNITYSGTAPNVYNVGGGTGSGTNTLIDQDGNSSNPSNSSSSQFGTGCNDYEVEIDTNSCDLGSCGTYLWSYNHYSNEFDGQEWYYPSQITECSSTAATVGASGGGTYDFGDYQEIWFYIGSGVNTYNITALNATDIHIERGSGSGNNVNITYSGTAPNVYNVGGGTG
ncbi:hypothetical protein OAH62_01745, partial [Candidatus Marinimicrobia bacterium]|nr:hypothetical protein [Candidatus Neomarinimicrobiota bacterium]